MATKTEQVHINIAGDKVGVQYQPATSEATLGDEHAAFELALHALCRRCAELRVQRGLHMPPVFETLIHAETFRDLM